MVIPEISTVLPPLYARWMDTLLSSPIPHENRATCDDCAMCAPASAAADDTVRYFSPRTKCCTYLPTIPNYLVGRALEDGDFAFSAGRATLEKRVQAGVGVTPIGVAPGRKFSVLYESGREGFGHAESMRCPHYLEEAGGRCGLWKHRNAICSTWFCKFERGGVGQVFWLRMRNLLREIERTLPTWCALEAGIELESLEEVFPLDARPGRPESLTAGELDGVADPVLSRRVWGTWFGREREFYGRCGRLVESLSWADVERIGGAMVSAEARLTVRAYRDLLSDELPGRLRPGEFRVVGTTTESVRVVGYAGADPLDLDPDILQILPYFDGRPLTESLSTIREEKGFDVERDLLRRLVDFGILVPSGP